MPGHIVIVDTATQQVAASFVDAPQELAFAPKGGVAYVATDRDTITVIDAAHQVVAGSLNVGGQQRHIAVTLDGAFVYATAYGPALFIIDAARNEIAGTVYVGGSAGAIAIGSDSVPVCPGDCDGSGWVSVGNIVKGGAALPCNDAVAAAVDRRDRDRERCLQAFAEGGFVWVLTATREQEGRDIFLPQGCERARQGDDLPHV